MTNSFWLAYNHHKNAYKDNDDQGFAECDAFQKGIVIAILAIGYEANQIKLFRHYSNSNIYMVRNGLFYEHVKSFWFKYFISYK